MGRGLGLLPSSFSAPPGFFRRFSGEDDMSEYAGTQHLHIGTVPPEPIYLHALWLDTSDPDDPVLKVKVANGWRVLANLGNP